ncbi:MAG: Arm DNA-binding domain-containing protein [Rudaea sp.]
MLTVKAIEGLKPRSAEYPKADGNGLAIIVQPNGRKVWRYRYRFAGKAKTLTLGEWPTLSAPDARTERGKAELVPFV